MILIYYAVLLYMTAYMANVESDTIYKVLFVLGIISVGSVMILVNLSYTDETNNFDKIEKKHPKLVYSYTAIQLVYYILGTFLTIQYIC